MVKRHQDLLIAGLFQKGKRGQYYSMMDACFSNAFEVFSVRWYTAIKPAEEMKNIH